MLEKRNWRKYRIIFLRQNKHLVDFDFIRMTFWDGLYKTFGVFVVPLPGSINVTINATGARVVWTPSPISDGVAAETVQIEYIAKGKNTEYHMAIY